MALTFRFFLAGLAGLLAWAIIEPTNPGMTSSGAWSNFELRLVISLGALVGATIGGMNGFNQGSRTHLLRGLGLGALFGAIGASFGYGVGGGIVRLLFGGVTGMGPMTVIARVVALAPLGTMLGAAIGFSSLNVKRAIQGAVGGTIGAALGAGVFDIIGTVFGVFQLTLNGTPSGQSGEVGSIPRAVFAVALSSLIGLFIGLVDLMSRSAWLRLTLGRNESKEWSLDFASNFIGRSETAQIPLFGDMNVTATHAVIRKHGSAYVLQDGGSPIGTYVNGHRIQQAELHAGDVIQVGPYQLQFLMKNQAAPASGPEPYRGPVQPMQPMQPMAPMQQMPQMPQMQPMQPMNPTMMTPQPAMNPTMAYPQSPMPSGFGLIAVDGPLAGTRFPVIAALELGRGSTSVPMAYDQQASRRHAQVGPDATGVVVTDLGSTNGTFINGNRIQQAQARVGDIIRIGSTSFRVEPV